jgi:hypothetical protein
MRAIRRSFAHNCHPERSRSGAKRAICGVEGPLSRLSYYTELREFSRCLPFSLRQCALANCRGERRDGSIRAEALAHHDIIKEMA